MINLRILIVIGCLAVFTGCAIKNKAFLKHQQETKTAAESFVGKPFKAYLETNPEGVTSSVPDGQGGYMHTVVVKPPMHAGSTIASTNYATYYIRFYVDAAGIITRVDFSTKYVTRTRS